MRRILSDQPLRPSELVAIRKLRRHIAKSVRSDFQFKVRFIHLPSGNIVARIVEISVSDEPPAVGALPDPYHGPERPEQWTAEQSSDPSAASISAEKSTEELFDGVWNAITSSQTSNEAWGKIAKLREDGPPWPGGAA